MADIENIRKQLNLNQTELAQELGISRRSYNNRIEDNDWKITELIKLYNMCNQEIEIKCGANTYSIKINKIA